MFILHVMYIMCVFLSLLELRKKIVLVPVNSNTNNAQTKKGKKRFISKIKGI